MTGRPGPSGLPEAPAAADAVAAQVTRGVRRALAALGQASLTEFPLRNGRRADILAIDGQGAIAIVEVKSSVADFRADRKWPEYRGFCDRFWFAVPADFPVGLIPEECGLLVADAYDAAVLREPPEHKLPPARRRALLLQFGLAAATRLHRLEDPTLGL